MTERRPSPKQLERRLERLRVDYEKAKAQDRRDRLHLRGQPARALHDLQQPQLPLRRSRPAPRPVLAAVLERGRQDRLQAALSRRRRPVPRVDRQPPPPRSRTPADARPLPPGRRANPRQPRPAVPRAPTPQASGLAQPARSPLNPGICRYPRVLHPSAGRLRRPKPPYYQVLRSRSEVATPK